MLLAHHPPTLFLARHATPDWNRRDIPYDIPPGPPLTAQGEEEARALGRYLRTQGVAKLYHSPLERTRRTAELAADLCGAALVESLEIAEWRRDENETAVLARMRPFWEQSLRESERIGPIALVTHGGCVLALLNWLQHPQAEIEHIRNQCDHRNPLPPAGAWRTTGSVGGPVHTLRLDFTPTPLRPFAPQIAYV